MSETVVKASYLTQEAFDRLKAELEQLKKRMAELQYRLYAEIRRSSISQAWSRMCQAMRRTK